MGIVNAHRHKPRLFIYTEQDGAAFILIGKAGQSIVKTRGTALGGGFQFQRLGLGFQDLYMVNQVL